MSTNFNTPSHFGARTSPSAEMCVPHSSDSPLPSIGERREVRERWGAIFDLCAAAPLAAVSSRARSCVADILAARNANPDAAALKSFFQPDIETELGSPFDIKNMNKACAMIAEVVRAGGKIAICSDYDVDGTTSAVQLKRFFDALGVESEVFVSDRRGSGYGLKPHVVEDLAASNYSFLLAVDQGSNDLAAMRRAKELGLTTLVIDHHKVLGSCEEIDCLVNPAQTGCNFADGSLCASALCWCLQRALVEKLPEAKNFDLRESLGLATLGVIADMTPLTGLNRALATEGLKVLNTSSLPGLAALKREARIFGPIGTKEIGFSIAPLLNAASRMLHGRLVVDLLGAASQSEAEEVAAKLGTLNRARQNVQQRLLSECRESVKAMPSLPAGIVVGDASYHSGVSGIVANQLLHEFNVPVAVLGDSEEGYLSVSMRGLDWFNVPEAMAHIGPELVTGGGHPQAGGGTVPVDKRAEFERAFIAECARQGKKNEKRSWWISIAS